jgi:hypothetical protein
MDWELVYDVSMIALFVALVMQARKHDGMLW